MTSVIYRLHRKIKDYSDAWKYRNERRIRDAEFIAIGKQVRYSPFESFLTYNSIRVGDNVFINKGAHLSGRIDIGDDVLFGPYVYITNGDHGYAAVGQNINAQARQDAGTVVIGRDCWICARAVITQALEIGEGCIVGAGSVVTRSLPPYCVCVGNPCKPIKKRYSDEELRAHFALLGRTPEDAEEIIGKRSIMNMAV